MKIDEWVVREAIDTLHQANITLLGITGLDSPQEYAKKCEENETAINRRIRNAIGLLKLSVREGLVMETNKIISPYFENEEFAGVRVCVGGEDFIIAPKDYREGKEMPWQEAMDALKADNLSTWNYRQICLTMAYRKEVDKVLVDNGGDSLDNWYWTCVECSAYFSLFYLGGSGILHYNGKGVTFSVRPIKNLKK